MDKPISEQDVREAIRSMARGKSPGPDGIPAEFYKTFTDLIAGELTQVLAEAHSDGMLPSSQLEGDIAVLYKKGDPRSMKTTDPSHF